MDAEAKVPWEQGAQEEAATCPGLKVPAAHGRQAREEVVEA